MARPAALWLFLPACLNAPPEPVQVVARCPPNACGFSQSSTGAETFCGACAEGACVGGVCDRTSVLCPSGQEIELLPRRVTLSLYADGPKVAAIATMGGGPGCTSHFPAVVELGAVPRVVPGDVALPTMRFGLEPTSAVCPFVGEFPCRGYVWPPSVRPDGLEMFFVSSYPCRTDRDREIWLSFRDAPGRPWSAPKLVMSLTELADGDDDARGAVLLADRRTLVVAGPKGLYLAQRPTEQAGSTSFATLVDLPDFADPTLELFGLGCDPRELLYTTGGAVKQAKRARVELHEGAPPTITPAGLYGIPNADRLELFEAPDCSAVFYWKKLRDTDGLYTQPLVPCP